MARCYVKAYYDWIEQTAALSDAERGRLFIAVLEYGRSGLEPKLDGRESILFPVFRATIDRDEAKSAVLSENGQKGGKKPKARKSSEKQNEANESNVKPNIRHKTEDKDKDKEKRQNIYLTSPNGDVCPTADAVRRVVEAWNALDICPISKIVSGSNRHTWLKARLKEYGEDAVLQAIDNVKSSDFLTGKTKEAFKITFDWFIRPNNFPKVLDGNYNDRKEQNNDGAEEQLTGKYGQYF